MRELSDFQKRCVTDLGAAIRQFVPDASDDLVIFGVAQSAHETGWWTSRGCLEHNNWFGHKTFSPRQKSAGPIRIFGHWRQSVDSWAYLVLHSGHYNKPRNRWRRDSLPSMSVAELSRVFWAYAEAFCSIYCPEDPALPETKGYWGQVEAIVREIRERIEVEREEVSRRVVSEAAARVADEENSVAENLQRFAGLPFVNLVVEGCGQN